MGSHIPRIITRLSLQSKMALQMAVIPLLTFRSQSKYSIRLLAVQAIHSRLIYQAWIINGSTARQDNSFRELQVKPLLLQRWEIMLLFSQRSIVRTPLFVSK